MASDAEWSREYSVPFIQSQGLGKKKHAVLCSHLKMLGELVF